MRAKNIHHIGRSLIVPVFFAFFYGLRVTTQGSTLDRWVPKWNTLTILLAMIVLELIFRYRYAVSQRSVRIRDIVSSLVNVYVSAAVTGIILLPILAFVPQHFLGRKLVFASSGQLGPLGVQIVVILLAVSFFRYWVHRWQHSNEFLWKLHSYHHMVTDLKASNTYVSHPIDWALRNAVVFVALGLIGFDPLAIVIAVPATAVPGIFSHCGGDVKGGLLNYVLVTPEVHRWHHAAEVPEGHKYSVNYGVEFSFWDILFGTFHLPHRAGEPEQPQRIGHPDGLADEPSYVRLLLAPLGLYKPLGRALTSSKT